MRASTPNQKPVSKAVLSILCDSHRREHGVETWVRNLDTAERMSELNIPRLTSSRLFLVSLSRAHSPGMFDLWSEPDVCAYSGPVEDSHGLSVPLPAAAPSDSDRILEFWLDRASAQLGFRWAVLLEGSVFVGAVGFNSLGSRSEYAYHFIPRYWGQGLATEASRLALEWAFRQGASVVEASIEVENEPSIRLAARMGFVEAGPIADGIQLYVLERGRLVGNG